MGGKCIIMGFCNKLSILSKISWTKFVYWNFLSGKVKRCGKGFMIPYRHSVINIGEGSQVILHDGHFVVNAAKPSGSAAEAYLLLRKNAVLEIQSRCNLCYKATIEIHDNARVEIGSAYINSDAVILAGKHIKLGEGCLISRMVFIYDADHHDFLDEEGNVVNPPREVLIGNHVWIGLKTTILRGSRIGDGAVVAAESLVGGKVKAGTMAAGNPARSYAEVRWHV